MRRLTAMMLLSLALSHATVAASELRIVPDGSSSVPWQTPIRLLVPKTGQPEQVLLEFSDRPAVQFEVSRRYRQSDGSEILVGAMTGGAVWYDMVLTLGESGAFARFSTPDGAYDLRTDASGAHLIEIGHGDLVRGGCATETPAHELHRSTTRVVGKGAVNVIDVMVVYTPDMVERYPGNLLQTRIQHLFALSNQVFANSEAGIVARLAATHEVNYTGTAAAAAALEDLAEALNGTVAPGLEQLRAQRDAAGADLVTLLWPHDIETRGACGIAYFPDPEAPQFSTSVVNDGVSSWSVCDDLTLVHEWGHNLGAGHQVGSGGRIFDPRSAAFVSGDDFHTVMGSFGTGQTARNRTLPIFSNPNLLCGGKACGRIEEDGSDDNAGLIAEVSTMVAGRLPSVSNAEVVVPERLERDADGDGVGDWSDAFPFDATRSRDADGDGVEDARDVFPDDPERTLDTDADGIANEFDPDDDDDGVVDEQDAFPLDPDFQGDRDLDAVADRIDRFPDDPLEQFDSDGDGLGDNAEQDADDDGFPDHADGWDLLVVSTGTGRVLRFDGPSGAFRGVEIDPTQGQVTFQTDLAWAPFEKRLYLGLSSDVVRFDPFSRNVETTFIPAYPRGEGEGVALFSGFPVALEVVDPFELNVARNGNPEVLRFTGRNPRAASPNTIVLNDVSSPIGLAAFGGFEYVLDTTTNILFRSVPTGDTEASAFVRGPWMRDPRDFAISADGTQLLFADATRNRIGFAERATGRFLGERIVLADDQPGALAVAPDGEILIASLDRNRILAAPAEGGEVSVRVPEGHGGLATPGRIVAVPRVGDQFPDDPARSLRPNGGLWLNPDRPGTGLDIQNFGNQLSALWYTYEPDGQPVWYFSAGELDGHRYRAELLRFNLDETGTATGTSVGSIQLDFSDSRVAEFQYQVDGIVGSEPLVWFEFAFDPADDDRTGLWSRADGPGFGLSLVSQGPATVAVAYVYDEAGEPRWVISNPAEPTNGALEFEMLYSDNPGLCPGCGGGNALEFAAAGTMSIVDSLWTTRIEFPVNGRFDRSEVPIVRLSDSPVRPR
ncbi:MAG: M12 family metallo-peptidase [Xanthomonadales bacterium]|nr:M12 family metallo-peptidase [Xanthomonadales bacterium]